MRFVTLFSGMMLIGVAFLGLLWFSGVEPTELYKIAFETTGLVSLTCKYVLVCTIGVPASIVLTVLGLWLHRTFPSLDRWVDSDYLETNPVDRLFLQVDSVVDGPREIGDGFRRVWRHRSVKEVFIGIAQILHGVIAAAFLVFILVGPFLVYYRYS